ncbi:MAG: L-seryl-tRNA(Sec) selenium transferase [Chloroflexi bacterium TMED70]|nr:MAG: L-seryl-tRNA(Sec) selenium transferase [Chloroflexi bacterium TMED70]
MNLKKIPSVNDLLISKKFSKKNIRRELLKNIINKELDLVRKILKNDDSANISKAEIESNILLRIDSLTNSYLKKIINGSGVILHTNLGRAPLSKAISKNIYDVISNYSDLEIDITTKTRNSRLDNISQLLNLITGAEKATVFNNNALALIVTLASLGKGKEILVSRSESIEIGGGFRIPEIIKLSGLKIVDIGTTNKTYVRDYDENITKNTVGFLKVHKSNYKIKGFTNEISIKELSELSKQKNIPIIHDLGSGTLVNTEKFNLPYEPTVGDSVNDGADITLFSSDKLLGGPQSGIVIGKKNLIEKINSYPLSRAARIDKLNLSILNDSLINYLKNDYHETIPVWNLINLTQDSLKKRANDIIDKIPRDTFRIREDIKSTIGGGTFPDTFIDSVGISIGKTHKISKLENYFLNLSNPIIGRIENDEFLLDLRTIFEEYDNYLISNINKYFK